MWRNAADNPEATDPQRTDPGYDNPADDNEVVDLRELVIEHRVDIFRFARSLTRSDADAEDLAQTAVVRALASKATLQDPTKAKSYFFRIVRNLVNDEARSRARMSVEPWAIVPEQPSPDLEPEAIVIRADDYALPRAAMSDLAAVHREVLQLRFVEELGYDVVAARLHTTEHAARQRVYRAVQALRAAASARRAGRMERPFLT
jgi:RNA polymerase sigma-70 factor, ECF subfamily